MTVSNSKTPNPINGTQGGEKDLLSDMGNPREWLVTRIARLKGETNGKTN